MSLIINIINTHIDILVRMMIINRMIYDILMIINNLVLIIN